MKTEAGSRPVRLLGVLLHGLEGEGDDLAELEDGQLLLPFGRARVEAP